MNKPNKKINFIIAYLTTMFEYARINLIKTLNEGYDMNTLKIMQDTDTMSPREWDNIGQMVCFHKRYTLGDEHSYDSDDYNSWDEFEKALHKEHDIAVILPLYLYDHSGITMKTTGFSCRWDSGQVGFIFVTKDKVRKEYNVKRISKSLLDKVESLLKSEVYTYDQYLTGDTYFFELVDENGNTLDSCCGFFGRDPKENGMSDYVDLESCKVEYVD